MMVASRKEHSVSKQWNLKHGFLPLPTLASDGTDVFCAPQLAAKLAGLLRAFKGPANTVGPLVGEDLAAPNPRPYTQKTRI